MQVIVIGSVAAGPKTAAKIVRLNPQAQVTIIEKGEYLSYAGCGLPYFVSGVIKEKAELMSTPVGVVRDVAFFQKVKGIKVLNHTEAVEIDRQGKRVRIKNAQGEEWLPYDKLVLATGARPVVPPFPGKELQQIYTVSHVEDAEAIREQLATGQVQKAVIVGGGLIGLEMAEALAEKGCQVTIVELLPQILPILDPEIAYQVKAHLISKGVQVLTGEKVTAFEGQERVQTVVTDKNKLPADLVIISIGVKPNVDLAEKAGLKIGPTRAIEVNQYLQTSDPEIYAVGDCAQNINLVTGQPCFVPLGSTANKHGRVAGINICGGQDTFAGVLGTTVCKVFDFTVARTGLTEQQAREAAYEVVTCLSPAPDKAHYYPTAATLMLKLVVDRKTRKLLGVQGVGPGDASKRIDVAATAISAGLTIDQLSNLDLAYAPPFAPAMDNLITAVNIIRNKIDGQMIGITPMEVKAKLDRGENLFLLDVRSPQEYETMRIAGSQLIPLGALRSRLDDVPRDREIIAFCKISLRGYEAALILKANGYNNVKVMDGGVVMWPYDKLTGPTST